MPETKMQKPKTKNTKQKLRDGKTFLVFGLYF